MHDEDWGEGPAPRLYPPIEVKQTPINTLNHKAPMPEPRFTARVVLVNGDVVTLPGFTKEGIIAFLHIKDMQDFLSVEITRD